METTLILFVFFFLMVEEILFKSNGPVLLYRSKLALYFILFMCICAYLCMCEWIVCPQRPAESIRSPGAGATGDCKLSNAGTWI